MTALLYAANIGKRYGLRPVLHGVSLDVSRGEFVAILGANGAGKTTLLRILATLTRPNSGALTIGGIDALAHPDRARACIGLVSHQSLIYPDLTARENLEFYGRMYGAANWRLEMRDSSAQSAISNLPIRNLSSRIEEALRRVNLWQRRDDPARTFSRGMIQRLAIARAILHDPPLLLLDEPFTGLDQASAANLSALLRDAALGDRAVVMTTHELSRSLDGVTRALVLQGGRIVREVHDGITAQSLTALMSHA
ncbi:MAG: ABC transporter ATP-binding protein [Chloroflexi bacterium]|jgi:ABC-type multidrug transport system ATPase subunit|uniref:ABC transporter ATP-binding protein n=1 Tax=Candidatus Thermofonsia Clade 3 bacterium TaxID=2364212 RepID=A0A2M8QCZ2_9CHLR|nr:ABC transporter ATP-binding protein [Candidatus Roseilinea sp. NK_OTU-006]PJF47622.1 MAG: ABC transporter ATP-binding protein [Candidatus Thermofonsia Clade 3 bacterium]RMG63528.1 MAG: ABC transporter ATP-binding protein [Chloroflexota bacterium]